MSDVKTTVLTVDTGGAITNIKDFKQHIEDLKGKLLGLEKGTEEYNAVAKELKDSQQKLNEVMDVAKGKGEAVKGSYDYLVKTMSELKKQWRATADETERAKLGEQILSINNQLKELDASTGNFQRNVGDYANAFTSAFDNLSQGLSNTVPGVGKLNTAFKTLMANPVVAFISAIAAALLAVINAMKNSESQFNRFKVATAGVKVVVDAFKNAISSVADAFVTLTEKISNFIMNGLGRLQKVFEKLGFDKWADSLGNFIDKVEEYTKAEQKAVDLTAKRRKINTEIVKTENKIADLRAKIAEKTKYSEEERLALIDEWEKAEKHRAQLAVDLAQEEYDIIKRKNALTESSTEDLDAENEAYNNLLRAQGQYKEALITINKQKSTLLKGSSDVDSEDAKLVQKILERLENAKKTEIQKITETYEKEKALLIQYGQDTTALDEEYSNKILAIEEAENAKIEAKKKELADRITEIQKRITDSTKSEYEIRLENLEEQYAQEKELLIQNNEDITALEEYYAGERQKIKDEEAAAQEERDKEVVEKRIALEQEALKSISSLISAFASIQETQIKQELEQGKITEETAKKRFEDVKKLQVGAAIMNTAAGAIGAFSQASSAYPAPWGQILGGIAAAAVVAAGAVQIANIKSQQFGSGSSSVSTPAVNEITNEFTPEYTQNVTTDSELSELSNAINSKPTYVSVTDIEDKQNLVKVRETETTY